VQVQINDAIHAVVSHDEWLKRNKPALEWFGFRAEPWLEDVDSLLAKTVQDAVIRITGSPPDIHARASAVDNRFFPEFGCATLCVGTRGFGNHAIDEYVEIESLAPLTAILAVSALSWCGYKE
jgi:acetylornithine deacetylase